MRSIHGFIDPLRQELILNHMLKDKNSNLIESLIRKYIVIYCEIRTVVYHWKLNWKRLVLKVLN